MERKLLWKLLPVGEVLERELEMPLAEAWMAGGCADMGMVEMGVDVPEEDA